MTTDELYTAINRLNEISSTPDYMSLSELATDVLCERLERREARRVERAAITRKVNRFLDRMTDEGFGG